MVSIRWSVLLLGVFVLLTGCGDNKPKLVEVSGKVTLDGEPMATGQIFFEAKDGTAPATLEVTGGAFSGKVSVGKKTVRISSFKKMPQKATGPGAEGESLENVVLPKYNTESTEVVEVKDPGPNQFEFKVTSK